MNPGPPLRKRRFARPTAARQLPLDLSQVRPRPVGQPPRGPVAPAVEVGIFDPSQRTPLMMLAGLIGLLVVAYWDMLALTSAAWSDDLYSHGWIIPLFSLGLLWLRWQPFQASVPPHERWLGLLILAIGLGLRLFAAEYTILPVDRLSFYPFDLRRVHAWWAACTPFVGPGRHSCFSFSCFRCRPCARSQRCSTGSSKWPRSPARLFCKRSASPPSAPAT